jgi:hypothetical protein
MGERGWDLWLLILFIGGFIKGVFDVIKRRRKRDDKEGKK